MNIEVFGYVYVIEVEAVVLPDGELWAIEHEVEYDCREGYSADTDDDGVFYCPCGHEDCHDNDCYSQYDPSDWTDGSEYEADNGRWQREQEERDYYAHLDINGNYIDDEDC